MMTENTAGKNTEAAEQSEIDAEDCPKCRSTTVYMVDKDLGYYKNCPSCGHTEHLNRRFLRFDRQSRRWQ